ncbi:MAG TPA: hypothetical protein VMU25_01565 [Candidatus Paceibacterota bacterium]|nr:hypothetical protein [Candidatus Paceibacterota bacterium]
MEDSEAVKILIAMLEKYSFDEKEKEAIKGAIGLMGWTKLVEGFNERRKKARDKKVVDL